MSYFEDLTNYSYLHYENSKNIGWLDKDYPYPKGKVSEEFIDSLCRYIHSNLMQARGNHSCNLCSDLNKGVFIATHKDELMKLGFAEIRVLSEDGMSVYAAPNLIYHYILDHEYRPPEEFIQAVLNGPKPESIGYKRFLSSYKDYSLCGKNIQQIQVALWGETDNRIKIIKEFHNSINEGNLKRIVELIDCGIEQINMIIPLSEWLYMAASKGEFEIVKYIISCGIKLDVSKVTSNPLFGAINGGYINIVKLLIENGIDISAKYNNEFMMNMDALALANKKGQKEIINLLQSVMFTKSINDKKL